MVIPWTEIKYQVQVSPCGKLTWGKFQNVDGSYLKYSIDIMKEVSIDTCGVISSNPAANNGRYIAFFFL